MLELSKIGFTVDTTQLVDAVQKVQALGSAVGTLATSMNNLDKAATKASKSQSDASTVNAKATEDVSKIEEKAVKVKQKTVKVTEESTEATKLNTSILERQQSILEYQTQGFSKGQSSILAMAKAAGVLTDDLKALEGVLEAQRRLMGSDPFDKSAGALKSITNEYRVLKDVQRQYNSESELTQKQMSDLALDKLRLIEAMKIEGRSFSEIKTSIRGLKAEYEGVATSVNKVTTASSAADKAVSDTARANAYLEKELQKVRFALEANNSELSRGTSNSLVKFQSELQKSGLSLDIQKQKLDEFRIAQTKLQTSQKGVNVDYITRAVGPQITDITVGLATGQSPLTVMLQQGGQLRDQFALAGVAAEDMGQIMKTAMSSMATSVFATGKAIGTMLVGGMFDAGNAVVRATMSAIGLKDVIESARYQLTLFAMTGDKFGGALLTGFNVLSKVITGVFIGGVLAAGAALVTLGVAYFEVTKQEEELSKALALTGASLGLNKNQAQDLADTLNLTGKGVGKTIDVITAMGKEGSFTADKVKTITEAAIAMEKYGGASIESTVKSFAKLQGKPLDALREIAIQTGLVSLSTLENVDSLEKQGNKAEAVSISIDAMAEAMKGAANIIKSEMTPLQLLWDGMLSKVNAVVGAIQNMLRIETPKAQLAANDKIINAIQNDFFFKKLGMGQAQIDKIVKENELIVKQINLEEEQSRKRADNSAIALVDKERNALEDKYSARVTKREDETAKAHEIYAKLIKNAGDDQEKVNELKKKEVEIVTEIARKLKDRKPEIDPEAKKLASYYATAAKEAVALRVEADGYALQLTKSEKTLEKIQENPLWSKLPAAMKETLITLFEVSTQSEKENNIVLEKLRLTTAINSLQKENLLFLQSVKVADEKLNSTLDLRLELIGKTTDEQRDLNNLHADSVILAENNAKFDKQRLEIALKFKAATQKESQAKDPVAAIAALKAAEYAEIEVLDAAQAESRIVLNKSVAVRAAEDMFNEMQKISKPIADAITTAIFDGGQAGAKSLRDSIVKVFREKISVFIEANVSGLLQSLTGGGGSGGGVAGSAGGSVVGSFINAGISKVTGTSLAALGGAASSGFQLGQLGLASEAMTAASTMMTNATGFASYAAGAAQYAGAAISSAISSVTSVLGAMGPAGWAALAFVAAAGTIGGKITKTGDLISGKVSTTGSSLQNVTTYDQDHRGPFGIGSFTTKNREYSKVDSGISGYIDSSVVLITAGVKKYASALGLAPDLINGISKDIEISIGGLDAAGQKKAIDKALAGFGDSLADALLTELVTTTEVVNKGSISRPKRVGNRFDNFEEFDNFVEELGTRVVTTTKRVANKYAKQIQVTGTDGSITQQLETSSQTLERLGISLAAVNESFKLLDIPLLNIGLASADTASKLIDAFGSLSAYSSSLLKFYDNFFTAQEKTTKATEQLKKQFSDIGIVMPDVNDKMRDWYKTEVQRRLALDQSIPANAESVVAILKLSDAVNVIAPAYSTLTAVVDANNAVIRSATDIANERKSIQDEINNLTLTDLQLSNLKRVEIDKSNIGKYDELQLLKAKVKIDAEAKSLQDELNQLTLNETELLKLKRDSILPANLALFDSIQLAKSKSKADAEAAALKQQIDAEAKSLQDELNNLTLTETELLKLKRDSILPANVALFDSIQLAKSKSKADAEAAALKQQIDAEAKSLQDELNQLTLNETQLLKLKRDAILPANQALWDSVQAAKAVKSQFDQMSNSMSSLNTTRFGLENELLTAQGNTTEVTKRIRDKEITDLTKGLNEADTLKVTASYDDNVRLKEQIAAQLKINEQAKIDEAARLKAIDDAARAADKALQDAMNATQKIKDAWKSVADSIFSEVQRIRGLLVGQGVSGFNELQSQFDTATGKARAGDQDAAKALPGLSSALLSLAESQASTLEELRRIQGQTAASLEQTALGISAAYGIQVPQYAAGGSYTGGMALVGEQGPELINFNQAGQVYTAAQTSNMLNQGSDSTEELRLLRNEVSLLRVEARATALNTSKLNVIIERSIVPTTSGDALLTKVAT